jgi:hypothetical protein
MSTPYTEEELREVLAWINWKDPLQYMRKPRSKERWFDGSNEKPIIPNWSYLKRRNLWTTHFAGYTLEIGPTLDGKSWVLYLEGQVQLGTGELEALKDEGTKLLLAVMLAKAEETKTEAD